MSYRELIAIRSEIIRNVIMSFQPHIFLVDHMPHGALGELAEPLQAVKKYSSHTKIVLGIRDILGAPEVIRRQWQHEGAFAAAEDFYDAVCIYGCPEIFDVVAEYGFPAALGKKSPLLRIRLPGRLGGHALRKKIAKLLWENKRQVRLGDRRRRRRRRFYDGTIHRRGSLVVSGPPFRRAPHHRAVHAQRPM
jgi:hypothetical protein